MKQQAPVPHHRIQQTYGGPPWQTQHRPARSARSGSKFPRGELEELRRRIGATRWPSKELVTDRSQGVQLAALQELARFWTSEYDWRRCEARLNALPQFKTEIDGLDIHFIHVKSAHENALPLIMTHGWPGSVVELLETIGPLTDPTAHGGRAEDAFHLVLPSIPGYGFSDEPTELGWGPIRIGRAWHELMQRLGYTRYVAQGGDVGSQVTDAMGRLGLDGLIGIHTNLLTPALGDAVALSASPPTEEEQAALDQLDAFHATGTGYFVEQATRPETIGYALLDSPIALAAWMIDHDTDTYEKIARAFVDKQPSGNLTREHIVDNITLYWLTGTGASAARSYWEEGQENARAAGQAPTPVSVPVGFTTFPGEIWRTPRSWVERAYPDVHLLQRGRQGRALRGVGGAGALLRGDARRVRHAAIARSLHARRRLPTKDASHRVRDDVGLLEERAAWPASASSTSRPRWPISAIEPPSVLRHRDAVVEPLHHGSGALPPSHQSSSGVATTAARWPAAAALGAPKERRSERWPSGSGGIDPPSGAQSTGEVVEVTRDRDRVPGSAPPSSPEQTLGARIERVTVEGKVIFITARGHRHRTCARGTLPRRRRAGRRHPTCPLASTRSVTWPISRRPPTSSRRRTGARRGRRGGVEGSDHGSTGSLRTRDSGSGPGSKTRRGTTSRLSSASTCSASCAACARCCR